MSSHDPATPAREMSGKPSLQVINQTQGENWNELDKRIAALEKSEKSFWKRIGMVLGIIGGLIAIIGGLIAMPKGLHEARTYFNPTPNVHLVWKREVKLTYDHPSDNFNLVYFPTVSNENGTAEDRVMSVTVEIEGPQSTLYPIAWPAVTLVEDNAQRNPIRTIGKGDSKDAQVNVSLKSSFLAYLLANPGPRETYVNFNLQSKALKPVVERFCLLDLDSDSLEGAKKGEPFAVSNTSCEKH